MSMIENLNYIKEHGINKFLKSETKKWQCNDCGELICCHSNMCLNCHINESNIFHRMVTLLEC